MGRVIQVPLSILCVEIRRTANEVYYASSERLHGPWPRFDWCYNGAFATNGSAVDTGTVYMATGYIASADGPHGHGWCCHSPLANVACH
jgi:hypothetical protein